MTNSDRRRKSNPRPSVPGSKGMLSQGQLDLNQRPFLLFDALAAFIESRPGGAEFMRANCVGADDLAVMLYGAACRAKEIGKAIDEAREKCRGA